MKCSRLPVLALVFTSGLALAIAPTALAQHAHGPGEQPGHKDGDHSHGEVAKAGSLADAAQRIAADMKAMDSALASGSLAGVSDKANAVATLAKTLGALALAKESGVPREKVKEINLASKELAETADNLHNIADAGDLAKSKAAFQPVKAAAAKVATLVPAAAHGDHDAHGAEAAPVTHSVVLAVEGDKSIEAGKAMPIVFTIKDAKDATVKDLDTVHEKELHLLVVSKDLSWFSHEHPTRRADGTFTMPMTFPAGGEYTLYFDFTPKGSPQQAVPVKVTATGTPKAAVPLTVDADKPKTIDGFTVTLDTEGAIKAGGKGHMSYTITKDGKPVTTLRPYLGAMGHLVIISEDRTQFVHAHPHEAGAGHEGGGKNAMGGPNVDFEAHFTIPGTYKGWAQFNVGTKDKEQVITVPFTFSVTGGDGKPAAPDTHKHSAKPVNGICPITREIADAAFTRDFKGQLVGFSNAASATTWDTLKDEERMSKFVSALAAAVSSDHSGGMPDGLSLVEARALYLVPGGLYTESDIKANGSITAYEKFKGAMSKHDAKPKPGDKVCPISMTKANPKFTWIIGGKAYEFCCPPCIDEFVATAKQSPGEIAEPSSYVKK